MGEMILQRMATQCTAQQHMQTLANQGHSSQVATCLDAMAELSCAELTGGGAQTAACEALQNLDGSTPPSSNTSAYPELYVEMGLPQYPGAEVTGVGRDNSRLENGITVKLQTTTDSSSLRSFFESALTAGGWVLDETIATSKMREAGILDQFPFLGVFKKGNLTYQVISYQSPLLDSHVGLSTPGDSLIKSLNCPTRVVSSVHRNVVVETRPCKRKRAFIWPK